MIAYDKRPKTTNRPIGGREETASDICWALEFAGVEFIAENGGGAGSRMKK